MTSQKSKRSKKIDFLPNRTNRYSIRKFTIGTASILVGTLMYLGVQNVNNEVLAAETSSTQNSNEISKDDKNSIENSSIQKETTKNQSQLNFERIKENAKNELTNMVNLNNDEVQSFLEKIEQATVEYEINDIINNAKITDQEAKEKANQKSDESKEETADETKEETADETKEETADESKEETSDESKEEEADESKEETSDESKEEEADESKEETVDESKEETVDESKEEESDESKEETADESKEETADKSKEEESDESKEETADKSKEEEADKSKEEEADKSKEETADESTKEDKNNERQTETLKNHLDKEGNLDQQTKALVDTLAEKPDGNVSISEHFEATLSKADASQKELLVNAILNSNLDSDLVASAKKNLDIDYNNATSTEIVDAITAEALKQSQHQKDLYQPAVTTATDRSSRQRNTLRRASSDEPSIAEPTIQPFSTVVPPENNTDYKDLVTVRQVNNNNHLSTQSFRLTVDKINVTYLPDGQIKLRIPVSTPKGINLGFNAKNRIDIGLSDSMKSNLVSIKNNGEELDYDSKRGTYFTEKNKSVSITAEGNELDVEVLLNAQNFKPEDKVEIRYNRQVNLGLTSIDKSANITFGKLSTFINKQKELNDQIQSFDTATDEQKIEMLDKINKANTDSTLATANNTVLNQAKEIAKNNIDGLTDLSNNDKDVYKSQVQDATSIDDISTIVGTATENNETNGLNNEKVKANTQIDSLSNLTNEEKSDFKNQVNSINDKSQIAPIVQQAIEQDHMNAINHVKQSANNTIDNLSDLTSTERTEFKERVNSADETDQIQSIVVEAQNKQAENQLSNAKNEATQIIETLEDLTSTEKEQFKNNIQSANSTVEIQSIVSEAQSQNTQNTQNTLTKAKEIAIKQIDNLSDLPEDEKENFKNNISNVININQIQPIIDSAEARDTLAALNKSKEKATTELEQLTNLTETKLEEYKNRIANATNSDQIQPIIDNAKQQDELNKLEKAKTHAKNVVTELTNLNDNEKDIYISQIDQANTQAAIETIIEQARQGDQTELLNNVKNNAKNIINDMNSLTTEQRDSLKAEIDDATNENSVQAIVKEAQDLNNKAELDTLRQTTNNQIESLENLNSEEKEAFKERVSNANDHTSINDVLNEALITNDNNALRDKKEGGLGELNNLTDLTSQELDDFKSQINTAQVIEDIDAILEQAKITNDENILNKAKTEAIDAIEALQGLEDSEKSSFKNQINNAKNQESINTILNSAEKLADLNNLNNKKAQAEETIRGLEGLSTIEKTNTLAQIQNSNSVADIQNTVDEAIKASDENMLNSERNVAIEQINKMNNLTSEESTNFKEQIKNAQDRDTIQGILSSAQNQADENALNKVKENAKETISRLSHIKDDELNNFNKTIETAVSVEEVNQIINEATQLNKQHILEELKENAKEYINDIEKLTVADKEMFNNQIDLVSNPEEVYSIIEEALIKEKDNILTEKKESAIKEIESLANLTNEERDYFIDFIRDEKQPENIDGTVDIAKLYSDLVGAKDKANTTVENLDGLTNEEIENFKERINNSESTNEVNQIVEEARGLANDKINSSLEALKAAQAQGEAINENDYTPNSYAPLKEAIERAQSIIDASEDHTQAEIDEATNTINTALDQLNERADKAELDESINEAEALTLDEADSEDKAVLDALERAKAVQADNNATAEEVKTAADALTVAIQAKETQDTADKKAAALEALKAAQAQGEAINENDYTPNSYAPLKEAMDRAQSIIDASEDHTQAEIDEATETLNNSIEQLIERADKAGLDEAISEAEALTLDEADAEDKAVLDALERAKAVQADHNATVEEVKTATDALTASIQAKETQDTADKKAAALEALKAAQAQGEAINENDYTPNSYAPLKEAIERAQSIIDASDDHTQAEIDEATSAINTALDHLNERADKTDLDETINEGEALTLDEADAEDKAVLDALETAKAVQVDDNATPEEVKTATDTLIEVIKLHKSVNESDSSSASYNDERQLSNTNDNKSSMDNHQYHSENEAYSKQQEINMSKENAQHIINGLSKLTQQQKDNFNKRINNANTEQERQDIVNEAEETEKHLPDTGKEESHSTTVLTSVLTFFAGLFLLRKRNKKKEQ